jgi:uncharacterized protein DUF4038/uncharacterized protein DUF5060/collagenase-like protein with putative collagen-binding domain
MKVSSKWTGALVVLSLSGLQSALALEVPLYDRFETQFTQTSKASNPYKHVTATVTFARPDGATVSVPMFWDGGSTWRVRFSPALTGTWSYTTSSSDEGLNNQSGTFDVIASANKGAIVQKPDAAYHFAYQDGTPVWWFGDTNWYQFSSIAAENLNRETANAYIDARAAQGFNVVHGLLYTTKGNEGGSAFRSLRRESINPAYWQEIDQRIAYMNSKGVTAGLVLAWGFGSESWLDFPSDEARLRFARYIAARYSAYNVYFLTAAEWGFWPHGPEHGEATFRNLAHEIANNDPHDRMIGVHAHTYDSQAETFADDTWSSFGDYQQYYGGAVSTVLASDANRHEMAERLAESRDHGKPVINAEYAYYLRDKNGDGDVDKESSHNLDDFRKASWVLAMTGGYFVTGFGSTYRGGLSHKGQFDVADEANNVAIEDLTLLRNFFSSHQWWTLEPRNDLVSGAGYEYGLAAVGQTYLVYTTSTTATDLSLGEAPPATYSVRRFDPRTGEYADLGSHSGTGPVTLSSPDHQDWVYVVQNTGPAQPTEVL